LTMPSQEQNLRIIRATADTTLQELMHHLNHAPHLTSEIKPLVLASDILQQFQTLADRSPETAEQLLRISLATLVNYNTTVETTQQLRGLGSHPQCSQSDES
jgi:hypothetical protein